MTEEQEASAVALLAVLVLLFGIMPVVASTQISSANLSLASTATHQAKVDAVFTQIFSSNTSTSDPNALKTQFEKLAKSFNDGLNLVQADEAALRSADQRLSVIQFVAPSKSAEITAERHRLSAALAGLTPAIITLGISKMFAGFVIVAIAGNAVENTVGIVLATKGKNDLAVSVVLNSVAQIAAFLYPALVLISLLLSTHLTFALPPLLIVAMVLTAVIVWQVIGDGEAYIYEGFALIGLYVVLAAVSFYE
jgi:Ca2+/Na+ antiporter